MGTEIKGTQMTTVPASVVEAACRAWWAWWNDDPHHKDTAWDDLVESENMVRAQFNMHIVSQVKPIRDRMRSALEAAALLMAAQCLPGFPRIVCLCGSTRFYEAWQEWNYRETMAGNIVLGVGFYPHCADKAHAAHVGVGPGEKEKLDELHKRKIDLADEVLVLNVGGYVGDSTRSEIDYATAHGKPVRYLEPLPQPPKGEA